MHKAKIGIGAALLLALANAGAATAADICTAPPVTVALASAPDIAAGAPITPGTMSAVSLWSADQITLAIPHGAATAGTFGGSASLKITEAGTYLFQSDTAVTIDVMRKGTAAPIAASTASASCGGFAQAAAYTLTPGDYVVQFAQSNTATLRLVVAK